MPHNCASVQRKTDTPQLRISSPDLPLIPSNRPSHAVARGKIGGERWSLGKHIFADFAHCNPGMLNEPETMLSVARRAGAASGSTVLGEMVHAYGPQGVSIALLLAESHLFVHTWPEYGYVSIDVFTCGETLRPERSVRMFSQLLRPGKSKLRTIKRGIRSEVGPQIVVPNPRSSGYDTNLSLYQVMRSNKRLRKQVCALQQSISRTRAQRNAGRRRTLRRANNSRRIDLRAP